MSPGRKLFEDPLGAVANRALTTLQLRREERRAHGEQEVGIKWYVPSSHQRDFFARLSIEQFRGNSRWPVGVVSDCSSS